MEIRIDRSACRGSMSCVRRAPATFSLDAERKSVAVDPPPDPDPVLREAAQSCPFFAIEILEREPAR